MKKPRGWAVKSRKRSRWQILPDIPFNLRSTLVRLPQATMSYQNSFSAPWHVFYKSLVERWNTFSSKDSVFDGGGGESCIKYRCLIGLRSGQYILFLFGLWKLHTHWLILIIVILIKPFSYPWYVLHYIMYYHVTHVLRTCPKVCWLSLFQFQALAVIGFPAVPWCLIVPGWTSPCETWMFPATLTTILATVCPNSGTWRMDDAASEWNSSHPTLHSFYCMNARSNL